MASGSEHFEQSLEVVKVLDGTPKEVFDKFKEHTWLKCGGPPFSFFCYLAEQGDPVTSIGQERVVALLVHERILNVVDNESIDYTVCKNFPCSNHHGRVTFEPSVEADNKTVLTWHVDYTPYPMCNIIIVIFVKIFFPIFLFALGLELNKSRKSKHD